MIVGETKKVSVYVTTNISKNNLNKDNETFKTVNITATPQMKVVLQPEQSGIFDITSTTNNIQPVAEGTIEWDWLVTPKKSGNYNLTLYVYIVFPNERSDIAYTDDNIRTYEELHETIYIGINGFDFLESNWQWLITVIILPAIGFLYKVNYSKKE